MKNSRSLYFWTLLCLFLLGLSMGCLVSADSGSEQKKARTVSVEEFDEDLFEDDVAHSKHAFTHESHDKDTKSSGSTAKQEISQPTAAATDDVFYDDEEFEGFVPKPAVKEAPKKVEEVIKEAQITTERTYYMELGYVVFLVLYGLNYFTGKKTNDNIARSWLQAHLDLFNKNFSKTDTDGAHIIKESCSQFTFKATGRVHCHGLSAELNLTSRQDLFSLIYNVFSPKPETVTIDVPMTDEMEPIVFAVLKKREEKQYRADNTDLDIFAKPRPGAPVPSSLVVYSELEDVMEELLHREVVQTLEKYENDIITIHFTDQNVQFPAYKKTLRFVYKLPKSSEMDKMSLLLKMTLHFIDRVGSLKLNGHSRSKAERHRVEVQEAKAKATHAERQELAQKRKSEKKLKEEEILANLSPEAQRKLEEKRYKQSLKKKSGKFQKMKVMKA